MLLAHAYTAAAFAWAQPATLSGLFEEKGVVYWAPTRPPILELITGVLFALSAVALLGVLVQRWQRPWKLTHFTLDAPWPSRVLLLPLNHEQLVRMRWQRTKQRQVRPVMRWCWRY